MAYMNTKDMLNRILRALRLVQNATTTAQGEEEAWIVQVLDQVKTELEEDYDWSVLRTDVTLTLAGSTASYDLVSSGASDTDVPANARLLYLQVTSTGQKFETSRPDIAFQYPQCWDVTSATAAKLIRQVSTEQMEELHTEDANDTGEPVYFSLSTNTSGRLTAKFWPTPDAVYSVKFRFVIPQDELSTLDFDGTTAAATMNIPAEPVWTEALYRISEERGDLSRPPASYKREANANLERALAREFGHQNDELQLL